MMTEYPDGHPYDEIRNHLDYIDWEMLKKLRRYIRSCQDVEIMGRGVMSAEEILKDLIRGYWI